MSVFYPGSTLHNPVLELSDESKRRKILEVTKPFLLNKNDAQKLGQIFTTEMDLGLSKSEADRKRTCLQQEVTFVTRLPDGTEKGDFLSLDLGSTNFRVLLSKLKNGTEDEFHVKYYDVPSEIRVGASEKLFNFMANAIADFLTTRPELKGKRIPVGFAFSYPMVQEAIDVGMLVTWTKSYDLPDAIGKNAVQLLKDAIKKRGDLEVDVVAILNDSTGTLIKGAYLEPTCSVGMILGSGFNACYIEQVDKIPKLTDKQRQQLEGAKEVVVDIECGGFGDNGCIDFVKNQIDMDVDNESLFRKSFSFEKMFSGNFIGDVARRVFLSLAEKGLLFDGGITEGLKTQNTLIASELVQIERARTGEEVRNIINVLGYQSERVSDDDVKVIKYVGKVVAVRGALLAASLLAVLVKRMNRPKSTVAIDGSLYKHHPLMHQLLVDYIRDLAPGLDFDIILAEDGSGKGAGLAAAALLK